MKLLKYINPLFILGLLIGLLVGSVFKGIECTDKYFDII